MNEEYTITKETMERLLRDAFKHGQGNGQMMESGLERDEIDDYVSWTMMKIFFEPKREIRRIEL